MFPTPWFSTLFEPVLYYKCQTKKDVESSKICTFDQKKLGIKPKKILFNFL